MRGWIRCSGHADLLETTLQQYVGRLHRLHDNKRVVRVYDYIDCNSTNAGSRNTPTWDSGPGHEFSRTVPLFVATIWRMPSNGQIRCAGADPGVVLTEAAPRREERLLSGRPLSVRRRR